MNFVGPSLLTMALMVGFGATAHTVPLLSETELQDAFAQARLKFQNTESNASAPEDPELPTSQATLPPPKLAPTLRTVNTPAPLEAVEPIAVIPPQEPEIAPAPMLASLTDMKPATGYTPRVDLADIRVNVNMEDVSLQQAVAQLVAHGRDKAGPWQIKWRISHDNQHILEDKMNVTAETTIGDFLSLMVDRVNNMTGVRLYISLFQANRMLLISDTYQ